MAMDRSKSAYAVTNKWVDTYGDELFSWALYKTSDKPVAEDLVQETFLAAFLAYKSFKGGSSAKTWLFRILNNKIVDHYRKSSKNLFSNLGEMLSGQAMQVTDTLFNDLDNWSSNGLEDQWDDEKHLLDDPEFNTVMDKCVGDLPDNWRTAVLWKFHLNKKSDEICQELQISPSNYWQVIHRAKLLLKKCLEINWFSM